MATLVIDEHRFEILRRPLLLDTNILVALFRKNDQYHSDVFTFVQDREILEAHTNQLLVPSVAIVEAWGLLVGKDKNADGGLSLLEWVVGSDTVLVLPTWTRLQTVAEELSRTHHVDIVDAYLAAMAAIVSEQCGFRPPIRIATYDTGDFLRCLPTGHPTFAVFDMRTLEAVPFGGSEYD